VSKLSARAEELENSFRRTNDLVAFLGSNQPVFFENEVGMHRQIERVIDGVLSRSPAQPLFRARASHCLTVLAYHAINDPDSFGVHMKYLRRWMHPVSLDDVIQAVKGRELPKNAVLVTFDDNSATIVEHALPLLVEQGLPAVAFVVAGLLEAGLVPWFTEVEELVRHGGRVAGLAETTPEAIKRHLKQIPDDQRSVAIEELRQTSVAKTVVEDQLQLDDLPVLESAGIVVGNHSLTHPCLPKCSGEKIQMEVKGAHDIIEGALGHPPRSFAYPNGDCDDRVVDAVSDLGYEVAFLFDHRLNSLPLEDPFRVSRVRVNSTTTLDRFRLIVSGLHPAIHHSRPDSKRSAATGAY
jgi:peptidoglycan/xylan/chitin deacetylase (PgdA/CDA1 family)